MIDFIREFKFGRPQQIAALLLLAFIGLVSAIGLHAGFEAVAVVGNFEKSSPNIRGQILTPISIFLSFWGLPFVLKLFLPALAFGLSLAGAIWWVTRRLYNDLGGYVALTLFCFSLEMIDLSALVSPDIVAAWGLYGLIYTAIGVAHTLYAPPRKWRPRILLLGVALGVTAGAYFAAALVGLILAIAFMLYLAPGRRKESLLVVAIASVIAFIFVWALYGFDLRAFAEALRTKEAWDISLHHSEPVVPGAQWLLLGILMLISLATYVAWKRARYFGNTAPLIALTILCLISHNGAQTAIWALPFVFTFIGGIFADLLETRKRKVVVWSLVAALAWYASFPVAAVLAIVVTAHFS